VVAHFKADLLSVLSVLSQHLYLYLTEENSKKTVIISGLLAEIRTRTLLRVRSIGLFSEIVIIELYFMNVMNVTRNWTVRDASVLCILPAVLRNEVPYFLMTRDL
jgi:hypothetical protein